MRLFLIKGGERESLDKANSGKNWRWVWACSLTQLLRGNPLNSQETQTSKKPIHRSCFDEGTATPAQWLLLGLGTSIQNGRHAGLSRVCRRFPAGSIRDPARP